MLFELASILPTYFMMMCGIIFTLVWEKGGSL